MVTPDPSSTVMPCRPATEKLPPEIEMLVAGIATSRFSPFESMYG